MTKHETKCLLGLALANWPSMQDKEFLVDATAALWYKMLGHLPYKAAEAGLAKVLLTARFFPTVAEILAAAESLDRRPDAPPPAEEAWDEVCRNLDPYRMPQWSHEAIRLTVRRMGGIRTLCESETPSVDRAHFLKFYELYVSRDKERIVDEKVAAIVSRADLKVIR